MNSDAKLSLSVIFGSVLWLSFPLMLRSLSHSSLLFGEATYALLSPFSHPPALLAMLVQFFDHQWILYTLLSIGLGALTLFLYLTLLSHQQVPFSTKALSIILVALSPALLQSFSTFRIETLLVPCTLIVILSALKKRWIIAGASAMFLLSAIHPPLALLAFGFFIFISQHPYRRISQHHRWISLLCSALLGFFLFRPQTIILYPIPHMGILQQLLAEFGGSLGISLMVAALAIFSFSIALKDRKYRVWLWSIIPILSFPLLGKISLVFAVFGVSLFASVGIISLIHQNWETILKPVTLLLIACGVVFTTIATGHAMANLPPSQSDVEMWKWMQSRMPSDAVIFSDPEHAAMLELLSDRPVLGASIPLQHLLQLEETRNPITAAKLLRNQKVTHIYSVPSLSRRFPWADPSLLEGSENFKSISRDEGIELWEVR